MVQEFALYRGTRVLASQLYGNTEAKLECAVDLRQVSEDLVKKLAAIMADRQNHDHIRVS